MDDEKLYNLLDYIKPTNSFIDSAQPSKPDYSNMDNWAAYPQKNGQQFYTPDQSYTVNTVSYTHSDAADDLLCVDLGGRRIIKKKPFTLLSYSPLTIPPNYSVIISIHAFSKHKTQHYKHLFNYH